MGYSKITALSLTDLFVQQIENMILSGELAFGEQLPPARELAAKMGVSRTVVTAGLVELEKLGFVDIIYPEYDMATKLAYRINKSKIREYLEFSNDYSIIEIAVPEKWVGKTLRTLDVRNTYGINVIAISHPSSHSVDISINPNNPLSKDDALVLLGTDEIIMKFAKKVE